MIKTESILLEEDELRHRLGDATLALAAFPRKIGAPLTVYLIRLEDPEGASCKILYRIERPPVTDIPIHMLTAMGKGVGIAKKNAFKVNPMQDELDPEHEALLRLGRGHLQLCRESATMPVMLCKQESHAVGKRGWKVLGWKVLYEVTNVPADLVVVPVVEVNGLFHAKGSY